MRPSLAALVEAGRKRDCQVIITYPNDDAGGRRIMREIDELAAKGLPFFGADAMPVKFELKGVALFTHRRLPMG